MTEKQNEQKDAGTWLKVFCPEARCLTEEEISNLPDENKRLAGAEGRKGVWLEVLCPEQACLIDEEKITVPVLGVVKKEEKGFWLNLFCPEDRCIAKEPTDLP
ncbi:MAG: hypothetical protein AB9866_02110 [Syntrophobacteraceae bacterium]